MPRYTPTERLGVNATEQIVLNEFAWIFREQPIVDMGIDAHIESVENGNPSGRLIAAQIKSGDRHLKEKANKFIYYGNLVHLDYWLEHSLPVIVVAHVPKKGTFWTHITPETVVRTKKAWKVEISKTQTFDKNSKESLENILARSKNERERDLRLALPFMRHIRSGGRVFVHKEDWHNKTLGRGEIKVITQTATGEERVEKAWFHWHIGYSVKGIIEKVFPWATVTIDEEFYEEHFDSDSVYEVFGPDYIEEQDLYPYSMYCAEVSFYRLELTLNTLGKAYLKISDFIDSPAPNRAT